MADSRRTDTPRHLVQFSTGAGSAEVAFRVVERYGAANVTLITADTLAEDDDNWRFAREVVARLGAVTWTVLADGRTPMQAGRDHRCVPNNRLAVCSRVLKRELIRRHLEELYDPDGCVVYLGFDWSEEHRLAASVEPWHPWRIAAPLMDPPLFTKHQVLDRMSARGIEPPRLYAAGFGHANCGGACVRGGQAAWRRLLYWNRDRYLDWENEEEMTRALLGKNVTILRDRSEAADEQPLSLRQFRERLEATPSLFDAEDEGACGCDWSVA